MVFRLRPLANIFLLLVLVAGCARTPLENQFVLFERGATPVRSVGECTRGELARLHSLSVPESGVVADSISLMNWNIYKGLKPGWYEDLERLSSGRELVLLQEARLSPLFESFLLTSDLNWSFNSAFSYGGHEHGVLIASQVLPMYSCGLRQTEPIIRVPKTAVVAAYRLEGSPEGLLVANVHSINFTTGTGAYGQQIEDLKQVLSAHTGPLIIAGDFNDWTDARHLIVAKFAEELELTMLPFEPDDGRVRFYGDPVDHIFFRGVEPVQFDVHVVKSSDHNPITATFRLKEDLKTSK